MPARFALSLPDSPMSACRHIARRFAPLASIILLHVAVLYALQSGLLRVTAEAAISKVVLASFITPERPRQPEPPAPASPRPAPAVKKASPPLPAPVVNKTPSPQAITAPPAEVAPPQPSEAPVASVASPAPSVAPAPPAQPRVVSSGIEYLQMPRPEYPPLSRRLGEEGRVMLRVLVNDRGRAEHAEVQKSSGSSRLDDAARQAILRAVFKPHIEDGRPVSVYAIVPIQFQLDS